MSVDWASLGAAVAAGASLLVSVGNVLMGKPALPGGHTATPIPPASPSNPTSREAEIRGVVESSMAGVMADMAALRSELARQHAAALEAGRADEVRWNELNRTLGRALGTLETLTKE